MKVEVIRNNDCNAHVFMDVRSVMLLGDNVVITILNDDQYEIPVNDIMTMVAEDIDTIH